MGRGYTYIRSGVQLPDKGDRWPMLMLKVLPFEGVMGDNIPLQNATNGESCVSIFHMSVRKKPKKKVEKLERQTSFSYHKSHAVQTKAFRRTDTVTLWRE